MLILRVFNASEGDSLLLEHVDEAGHSSFAMIDCNRRGGGVLEVREFLRSRHATSLSFALLTHPHADHFRGFSDVISEFPCAELVTFPMTLGDPGRLRVWARKFAQSAGHDNPVVRESGSDFLGVLRKVKAANSNSTHVELIGQNNLYQPVSGFSGVSIRATLPNPNRKGRLAEMLNSGGEGSLVDKNLNALSVALVIKYAGKTIYLGGDSTLGESLERKRYGDRRNEQILADVVKISHHGSRHDVDPSVLDYIFRGDGDRYALISANGGVDHPHASVLTALIDRGIEPYCTNLSAMCRSGAAIHRMHAVTGADPELRRMVQEFSEDKKQTPCQGNIELTVRQNGDISVATSNAATCIHRLGNP